MGVNVASLVLPVKLKVYGVFSVIASAAETVISQVAVRPLSLSAVRVAVPGARRRTSHSLPL